MTAPLLSFVRLTPHDPDLPLLFVGPSLGTSVETLWAPTAALLEGVAEVVGWDLPGHGVSPAPTGPVSVDDLADGVAGLLASLRADRPADSVAAYAGVSVGGATGLALGVRHPGAADGIVVVCSAAWFGAPAGWTERAATVRAHGTAAMVDGCRERWFGPGFTQAHPEAADRLLTELAQVDDEGYAAVCEALGGYDVRADLGRVTDAVLTINGEADVVTPPSAGEAIVAGVPDGRAVALPGVAHLAPTEDPRATATLIGEFLDELKETR